MGDTQIPLYHCNHESVTSQLMTGKLVISQHPNDDSWGGRGMYFWDNLGNARYWSKQKCGETKIVRCVVNFNFDDDILDLTDYYIESKFAKLLSLTGDFIKDKPIGKKIDYLCKNIGYKIVRFFGEYEQTPQTDLINDTNIPNKLTNKVKIIYCVKNNNLIISDFKEFEVKEL